ncbi:hypothetical protein [Pseudaestuariivita atlantica]|uniref:Uncharacterized protein n=1 Tax=Pseudaestuariivita atlantica TaxID=1317121 RepID=A0A0L1JK16_9RHOB|nr:hypothetical protein [Pseudaestuariivita atlantica]KNG92095.1 hypothetical protein ATO11_19035 [Pseudaestuariivita atlantica]
MADLKLDYAVTTAPDPLNTNTPGQIQIAVTNPGRVRDLEIAQLSFGILNGLNAKDLTNDPTAIELVYPKGWGLDRTSGSEFVFTPLSRKPMPIGGEGLLFVLNKIPVNGEPGLTDLYIIERAGKAGKPPTEAGTSVQLAKFPQDFRLDAFTADPSTVGFDDATTLAWKGSKGATYSISYDDKVITHVKGDPDAKLPHDGTYRIDNLLETTTFTLDASLKTKAGSLHARRQATVTVEKAKIYQFNANPLLLDTGQKTRLIWTTNADACDISPAPGKVDAPSGAVEVAVDKTTTFTLTATKGKNTVQMGRTINVRPPKIMSFTSDAKGAVKPHDPVVLSWEVESVATLELDIDGTRHDVKDKTSFQLAPQTLSKCTLAATGDGPPQSRSLDIAVVPPEFGDIRVNMVIGASPTFECNFSIQSRYSSSMRIELDQDGFSIDSVTGFNTVQDDAWVAQFPLKLPAALFFKDKMFTLTAGQMNGQFVKRDFPIKAYNVDP